ncbi:MAG: DMT family transporter [Pseudorhodobacter sp.]|nr:DMT family transporter [Pseudorhodobacter sp.]
MPQTHRPLAAALWMIGSILAFSAMAVAGREASHLHDTFEIMLWRSVVGLSVVLALGLATGRLREIRRNRLGQHFARNLVHFTGQNLWFWALTVIPLAQVFALEFTSPIWVILLSPLFLGERITPARAVAAGLGFAGILIVARPDFAALNPGVVAAAASAICFATTVILTKALTRGESIVSILFWLTLMQACFGAIGALADGVMQWPTAASLPWLVVIGLTGVFAHFCLTTALSLASASVVVPVDFARLPVIAVVAMVLYGEPLDGWVLIGGAVIFVANWINIRAENRVKRPQLPLKVL